MKAWHFTGTSKRLGYGDGRLIEIGRTLKVQGDLRMCHNGLHASKRLIDALEYAPGPYVWRVEIGGDIIRDNDKAVASERTALWGYDSTDVLKIFSRRCALDVVHLWDAPDVVVKYLRGGDQEIRDASKSASAASAAWDAWDVRAASYTDAAWAARAAWDASAASAAWDACVSRAASTASTAARAAAATSAAAWDSAAWNAVRTMQNRRLEAMIIAHRP